MLIKKNVNYEYTGLKIRGWRALRNKEVTKRKGIIDIYVSTGTHILHHCCLNWQQIKCLPSFLAFPSPQATLFYQHWISIPPQLLPSPKTKLSCFIFYVSSHSVPCLFSSKTHFSHFLYTCHHLYHPSSTHLVNF